MTTATFRIHPTPVGDALLLHSAAGLIGLEILDAPLGAALEPWVGALRSVPVHDEAAGDETARQLDEYFDGDRSDFDLPVDLSAVNGFHRLALEAVRRIPYGETASYGEVAISAGTAGAARAVGTACRLTPISLVVPVHRVVRADGSIGEYGGRPEIKRYLLDLEGTHRPAGV
ncbi:methylated-DNA--[protein]-cysteine S-methyltransferase [Microbacterium sp. cx-55]|uniref:methylated-DNA--[protein]-cysteine S-methyltransferase n=1 Tax=Microbacterium sp. cx-55 TaxID=2875948 RepID=UPI001CBBBDCB|nr:methylated-DNA--[protein]-cysteine S-methyltransferase [Microbacterium sp. cx-55]MBZ4488196.1 methylated-DNA--[protein]-cysteine S-methyltransferase [Microbacterium sp. cx-55]UGB34397.1 methylated-DNA--[protein]-cysteine S-methyltransferase [Microbacterium sp. cx-55]